MVISHILGQMGRCLAAVTWLELSPHQSDKALSTCQLHQARNKKSAVSAQLTHCFDHHPCLAHTGAQSQQSQGRQACRQPWKNHLITVIYSLQGEPPLMPSLLVYAHHSSYMHV